MTSETTGLEIAVIGLACRFPGAPDVNAFWRNLFDGICSVKRFTDRELLDAGVDEATLQRANYVRARGLMGDAEAFDASFFGYSPRQAQLMDPQFRVLHECAWACLEDAGIDPFSSAHSIGLYAGAADNTWWNALSLLNRGANESEQFAAEQLCNRDFLCTLVAHRLNLKGPAVVIQSACSTSLMAVHAACRALLTGECRVALAGGVALTYPRGRGYLHEDGMIFSPEGECRPFDARADGTVPGEGVGLVALKTLKRALTDDDSIHAVIKATAANNDGSRKSAYTAPSVEAQAEVIRTALQLARTPAESIGYLEAHGTGTPLGDPVEIAALVRAFDSTRRGFCRLGSVKSNLGHLDTAAGVAGLIKAVLALKFAHIPKSLHFRSPNPAANLSETPFRVAADGMDWPAPAGSPRRTGVSSFGIGGTNVHAVLEEVPRVASAEEDSRPQLLVFSARSPEALGRLISATAREFLDRPDLSCCDTAYTLQTGRAAFEHRATMVVRNLSEVAAALEDSNGSRIERDRAVGVEPEIAFVFPGCGGQYAGMASGLYDQEPVFREHVDHSLDLLPPSSPCGIPWREFLAEPDRIGAEHDEAMQRSEIAWPLVFVVEYAMGKLALSWGLNPKIMLGEGPGALAAACLKGELTLNDALLRLVASDSVGRLNGSGMPSFLDGGILAFLELGPGGAHRSQRLGIPSIRSRHHKIPDREFLLNAVATLWRNSFTIEWSALYKSRPRKVSLPGYPFERTVYTLPGDPEKLLAGTLSPAPKQDREVQFQTLSWRQTWPALPGSWSLGPPSDWVILAQEGSKLAASLAPKLKQLGHSTHSDLAASALPHRILFVADSGHEPLADLFRTLAARRWSSGSRLTVLTDSAFRITGREICQPRSAVAIGFCLAARAEFSQWQCHTIDVDGSAPDDETASLVLQICSRDTPPPRSACRGGMIWEPERAALSEGAGALPIRNQGVYLITGGLGGIGLTLARMLARDYQARLVLVSRKGRIEEWNHGPRPLVLSADVADVARMTEVFEESRRLYGRIDGVIHAAGVPGEHLLIEQSSAEAGRILRAKVDGALVIEQLLGDDYDFLALMSSVDAWNPGLGQSAYAGANAFLDAFATDRRAQGKPVLSINWDTWLEVGMADRAARNAGLRLERGLTPEEGEAAFCRALASGQPNIVVSKGAWEDSRAKPTAAVTRPVAPRSNADVSKLLQGIWKSFFGVDDVDLHQNFFELGATSLDIVQLTGRIQAALDRELPYTALYDHPTIYQLTRHLAELAPEPTVTSTRTRNLLTQRARR